MTEGDIAFTFVLTSSKQQPFVTVKVPPESPFAAVVKFAARKLDVNAAEADCLAALTDDGTGVNISQTAALVSAKYGTRLRLVPRDRVGAINV